MFPVNYNEHKKENTSVPDFTHLPNDNKITKCCKLIAKRIIYENNMLLKQKTVYIHMRCTVITLNEKKDAKQRFNVMGENYYLGVKMRLNIHDEMMFMMGGIHTWILITI